MRKDFLGSVAEYLLKENRDTKNWKDLCVVFPSHRAGVFFRNTMKECVGGSTIFGPKVITLDDLIMEKASRLEKPLIKADNMVMSFELYMAYNEVSKEKGRNAIDFEKFYGWSPMFLGDFDDIDKYMVNAAELLKFVKEYQKAGDDYSHLTEEQKRVIEAFWGVVFSRTTTETFNEDGSRDVEEKTFLDKFCETYDMLNDLYDRFNKRLDDAGMAYAGKIYRTVAERVEELFDNNDKTRYVFVGFNALTKSEERILDHLNKKDGRVTFFWDYSEEMLEDLAKNDSMTAENQIGPGRFIRQYCRSNKNNYGKYPSPKDYVLPQIDNKSEQKITIKSYAYPQGQMAHIGKYLNEVTGGNPDKLKDQKTAIVLTDENMLIPVISALPTTDDFNNGGNKMKVNVTMGYPMKFSQAYGLMDLLVRLHKNAKIEADGSKSFYHKNVRQILQHPYISGLCGVDQKAGGTLLSRIVRENITFVREKLASEYGETEKAILRKVDAKDVAEYVIDIMGRVAKANRRENAEGSEATTSNNDEAITGECVKKAINTARRFDGLLKNYLNEIEMSNACQVMTMLSCVMSGQTVDFKGEPLNGLQIMGILETRAVDFDNLVILDLNEGIFPKKNSSMTFFPYVIRKSYGLPTQEHQDSIFSYYFFRLINRAKRVDLLYSANADAERQGVSRFIQQIKYEYKKGYQEIISVNKTTERPTGELKIRKTEAVKKELKERFSGKNFLSPSALTNYIKCPILFYLQNVLRIDDTDEVTEEVDTRLMGSIFHGVMESLYGSVGDGIIDKESRKKLEGKIENEIMRQFDIELFKKIKKDKDGNLVEPEGYVQTRKEDLESRNILTYEIISDFVKKMLTMDHDVKLLGLEKRVMGEMEVENCGKINIGGIIDRLHEEGGSTHIVDYKTGHVGKITVNAKDYEEVVEMLFDTKRHDDYKAIMQTMIYAKILHDKEPDKSYKCGVIYMLDMLKNNNSLEYTAKSKTENVEELEYGMISEHFTKKLQEIVEGIMGGDEFVGNRDQCSPAMGMACKFNTLCNKCINSVPEKRDEQSSLE